ncbi:pupal cuticle protein 36-like [Cherax quadricarinatus]|uniref:pupal cuticle protein 36-like n=1 Tax=Cherax quadricarinatus TaxID=27406 RepID=UPI00387EE3DC
MILEVVFCTLLVVVGADKRPSTSYGVPARGSGGFTAGSRGGFGISSVRGSAGGFGTSAGGAFGGSAGGRFGASSGGAFGGSGGGGFGRPAGGAFGGSAGVGFGGAGSGSSLSGSYTPTGPVVPILVDDRQGPDEYGNYNFNFETGDGISRQEQGAPQGPTGAVAAQGGWTFTFPDGTPAAFNFIADEGGYRVESDLVPTPHPLPAHAIAQIEKARQEDAAAAAAGGRGSYSDASSSAPQFTGAPARGFGGSPAGGFGASPAGGFGASPAGGFGASPAGGFGASPAGGFGASPAGGFGGSPAGGFGTSPSSFGTSRRGGAPVAPSRTYGAP